jgi:hypothetical protein
LYACFPLESNQVAKSNWIDICNYFNLPIMCGNKLKKNHFAQNGNVWNWVENSSWTSHYVGNVKFTIS